MFDFSFKEIQSSSGLLLFLWIYYPKIFIESLVDICLLCLENCRDLFFTFRDLYLISLASHLTTPPPPPRPHQSVHWFRLLCQLPPRRFPHCFHGLDPYFHDLLCFLVHLITLWKMSSNYLENRCVRVSFLCPFVSFLLLPHLIDGFDWVWIMKGDLFSPRALKALLCCILACLLLMEGLVLLILIPLYAVFLS